MAYSGKPELYETKRFWSFTPAFNFLKLYSLWLVTTDGVRAFFRFPRQSESCKVYSKTTFLDLLFGPL